jgi:hypothetical protein
MPGVAIYREAFHRAIPGIEKAIAHAAQMRAGAVL